MSVSVSDVFSTVLTSASPRDRALLAEIIRCKARGSAKERKAGKKMLLKNFQWVANKLVAKAGSHLRGDGEIFSLEKGNVRGATGLLLFRCNTHHKPLFSTSIFLVS